MINRIAHITDLHLNEPFPFNNYTSAKKRFDMILKDIEHENITQIICTGDIGENKGVPYFFEQLSNKNLLITLGNHDNFIEISKHYNIGADYLSKKIYSSVIKEHHQFLYLDSSEGIIDEKQLAWLKRTLISNKPIVIFMHHPIIGLNLKVDEMGKLKNRNKLISILTEIPNKIHIYCGHYHMESTLIYKNVTQFITPSIAFQVKKNIDSIEIDTTISGYRIIKIESNRIFSKVKLLNNAD